MSGTLETSPSPPSRGDFAIGQDQLAALSRNQVVAALQRLGGASLPLNFLSFFFLSDFCVISTYLSLILYIIYFSTFTSGQRTIRFVKNKFGEGY